MDILRYYRTQPDRVGALGNDWDDVCVWREAVAEWQLARERYEADPENEVAYHQLKAAEARIKYLRDSITWERGSLKDWLREAKHRHPGTWIVVAICGAALLYVLARAILG